MEPTTGSQLLRDPKRRGSPRDVIPTNPGTGDTKTRSVAISYKNGFKPSLLRIQFGTGSGYRESVPIAWVRYPKRSKVSILTVSPLAIFLTHSEYVHEAGSVRHYILQLHNSTEVMRAALFSERGLMVHLNG